MSRRELSLCKTQLTLPHDWLHMHLLDPINKGVDTGGLWGLKPPQIYDLDYNNIIMYHCNFDTLEVVIHHQPKFVLQWQAKIAVTY